MAIKFDNIEAINLKNHAGTNVLTLNSSNTNALFAGNVGIGMTSAPAGKLEINGGTGVATSGGTLIVRQDGDTSNDGIALTSSNAISHRMFKNAGGAFLMGPSTDSDAFALDLNGNVGIGTGANVDEKLHIQGSVDNDDIALKIENNFDNNSSANPPSAAVLFQTASNNGHIRVFGAPADTAANHRMDVGSTAGSSYLTFSPSGTEKMRIAANGYVGIGTEDPLTNLHVSSGTSGNATVIIEADTDNNQENDLPRLWFKADGGITEGAIQLSDNQLDIISNCNFASGIVFKTGNTNNTGDTDPATGAVQRMIITNDGNVEIGDKNYSYGGDNYHIGLKSTISSQDKTAYISNIQGSVVISAGGYYYGSNLRQLNSSNTTYGGIVLTEAGDFRIESLSGGTAGNTAGTSNKFIVASNGATTTYGNYIRSQHDGNHYAQIENNSSGGVLKAVSGGTTSVMFRSYGDSYITNDLGIGVTGPAGKLHVDAANTKAVSLTYGAEAGQIFTNENSEFAFGLHNNGPYPLYIQGRTHVDTARQIVLNPLGGHVGIGTLNPEKELEVDGDVKADAFIGQRVIINGTGYHSGGGSIYALYATQNGMTTSVSQNRYYPYAPIIMPFNGVVEKIILKNIQYSSYQSGPSASGTARIQLNQYDSTFAPMDYSSGNVSYTAAANVSMTFSPNYAYTEGKHFRVFFTSQAAWRYVAYQIVLKQTS